MRLAVIPTIGGNMSEPDMDETWDEIDEPDEDYEHEDEICEHCQLHFEQCGCGED